MPLINGQPLPFKSDTVLLWQSAHKTIGHTNWKVVVYEKHNELLNWRTGERGTARYTGYFWWDGYNWMSETAHPRYDSNDGTYAGLPKGLRKMFYDNESTINGYLHPETVYQMVEGEGAPQYTFDVAPETQLSLL
jgi:hypothetical protein